MRIEFAKIRFRDCDAKVTEVAHLGDVDRDGGRIRFADGIVNVERSHGKIRVDLRGLKGTGLFHGRHLRRIREIGVGWDGSGCAQVDENWIVVVHEKSNSKIYERLGRKAQSSYNEGYWHL